MGHVQRREMISFISGAVKEKTLKVTAMYWQTQYMGLLRTKLRYQPILIAFRR
jgi:hypothetical protein